MPGPSEKTLNGTVKQNKKSPPRIWPHIVALAAFIGITGSVLLLSDKLVDLERLGYIGALIASAASSATIFLPAPGMAITFALGGTLPLPLVVGLAAGLGETIGELTGYLAGYSGRAIVQDRERYQWLVDVMQRFGVAAVFVLAAIPSPFFDLAGMAAGALRFPVGRFLLVCWPGKTIKTTVVAYAGAGLLPFMTNWVTQLLS